MTQETRTIEIAVYRTPEGEPTCGINFQTNQRCRFVGFRKFGLIPVCMMGQPIDLQHDDYEKYIQPHADCELWKGQE